MRKQRSHGSLSLAVERTGKNVFQQSKNEHCRWAVEARLDIDRNLALSSAA